MNLTQHRVQVVRAEVADRATLVRLLQLYLYDFSAFAKADEPCGDVGEDGSFAYDHFESYWSNDRREPLLLRSDCQLVGFALINDWSASGCAVGYCMAEFFVLRKYRPAGIGASAAHEIIAQRPGVGRFQWLITTSLRSRFGAVSPPRHRAKPSRKSQGTASAGPE